MISHVMNGSQWTASPPSTSAVRCLPPCPSCGGLECLCRPRFFAGQLLTEEDLRRLDQYIVGKNRLHNRALHGWGVACGLEVVCNACGDGVTVRPGYAVSPCGDDIVVCEPANVDICALIDRCREKTRDECERPVVDDCEEETEEWVLAICYDEKPSRGVTPLRGGSDGCGCGNNRKPPSCEPTVVCETFSFSAYRVPQPTREDLIRQRKGGTAAGIDACIQQFVAFMPKEEDFPNDPTGYCCALKAALRDYVRTGVFYDCTLDERLAAVRCTDQDGNPKLELLRIAVELLVDCLCSSLLPPCPEKQAINCVPIATVTVRRQNCTVLRICNWEARRFLVTMPALGHWFGSANIFGILRRLLERICCGEFSLPERQPGEVAHLEAFAEKEPTFTPAEALMARFLTIDLPENAPRVPTTALTEPSAFLLGGSVGSPLIQEAMRSAMFGSITATSDIRREINELRQMVQAQQETIRKLSGGPD